MAQGAPEPVRRRAAAREWRHGAIHHTRETLSRASRPPRQWLKGRPSQGYVPGSYSHEDVVQDANRHEVLALASCFLAFLRVDSGSGVMSYIPVIRIFTKKSVGITLVRQSTAMTLVSIHLTLSLNFVE